MVSTLFDGVLRVPATDSTPAGELVYLNVFGQGLLFVNSYEAAVDLLEKRGAIYSDKPKMVMAGELCALPSCFAPLHMSD